MVQIDLPTVAACPAEVASGCRLLTGARQTRPHPSVCSSALYAADVSNI